ncbi:MBL fold metallo-hydrolase [Aeromicrobium sp. CTD01-1L150]|uniref:MBL fold metallo-hydrolase n=1 Tax=Aeromicrobium sp. CTD01-1L150 TaxID=3341830 RepID=UPI0035BEF263
MVDYTLGLHEVADGVRAWLAPDGGWGLSNAGLISGEGESFLIDTLFDYDLTRTMLSAMQPITNSAPIVAALNTHANGDHTFGNSLLDTSVRIHATTHTGHEMHDIPPKMIKELVEADLGPVLSDYMSHCFGAFNFEGVELRDPDVTFDDEIAVTVGGRDVRLVELAPAHTHGDSVAFVPDTGVLFGGDLLFIGGTPISWSGAVDNWISACDRMVSWDPQVVVPGHGPVVGVDGIAEVRAYLCHVRDYVASTIAEGLPWLEAVDRIDLDRFASLHASERIIVTTYQMYRAALPETAEVGIVELFGHAASWRAARGAA